MKLVYFNFCLTNLIYVLQAAVLNYQSLNLVLNNNVLNCVLKFYQLLYLKFSYLTDPKSIYFYFCMELIFKSSTTTSMNSLFLVHIICIQNVYRKSVQKIYLQSHYCLCNESLGTPIHYQFKERQLLMNHLNTRKDNS